MNITEHPLYITWSNVFQRTTNSNHPRFCDYGGRGITLHPDWLDSRTFIRQVVEEIGERPEGMTLDRIDNDDGYKPGNIRWATGSEQQSNCRRRNNQSSKHGIKYVFYVKKLNRWRGQFRYKKKLYQTSKSYITPEEAHQAIVTIREQVVDS